MIDMTEAKAAADLASLLPTDHPLARLGRLRLDAAVRRQQNQEQNMRDASADPDQAPPTLIGSPLRDASVDPLPGDLMPTREVRGHPGKTRCAHPGEPEFDRAATAARRTAEDGAV